MGRAGLIESTYFLSLSHDFSQLFNFTCCASASTDAGKCVKHRALLEYNAVLCGQMLGHISCITAFGAQIPLTGITGDDPQSVILLFEMQPDFGSFLLGRHLCCAAACVCDVIANL